MMLQPSCLVGFITLWFSLELACKASMTTPGTFFPLPTNLKILLYPGIINVTWDCNITKSMEEHTYTIEFQHDIIENINISKCFHEHFVTDHLDFTLYNGLELNISSGSEWKFEKAIPEGNSNTAAENLDCKVYNVSLINCSWTVGREAPKDTQYALAFRETPHESQILNPKQNRLYVPCKDYRTDSFGRQVGCVLRAQNISFNVSIYVQLVGSSNETSIQFFDEKIKLDHFVILDPPRNIHMNFSSTELEIIWETPETHSNIENHCFIYSVKINGDIKDDIEGYSYKTSNLHLNEKVTVSLRAKWADFCSEIYNWSRWSDPHIKGK
ncbi:granulocyte-macrophage colony-stimulating factor receptor subunit alpha-like [Rana temporaria]|uniref:granulocyte-macrophage colony-stimulating factor receptor subunit alpha-like n=1 Tax=Rana temporaria TaxID=8407 RepID=UPI001AADC942|nr:granulocyte-macrophage colony-stimulating factor receptor subunit alpha-like [Rana temporaria]XP_040194132.1 granulocyte-macrophage colony-stimulating factor receptor subunit alpha-like [Rana temporaria]